jgi:hypothetical protein
MTQTKRCKGQHEDEVCPLRENCLRYQQLRLDIYHKESNIPIENFKWEENDCKNKIDINYEI